MDQQVEVTFDAKLRDEWVQVDAIAWGDDVGIYRTAIKAVWFDGVNVIGLLSNADIGLLDVMIPDAVLIQNAEK